MRGGGDGKLVERDVLFGLGELGLVEIPLLDLVLHVMMFGILVMWRIGQKGGCRWGYFRMMGRGRIRF